MSGTEVPCNNENPPEEVETLEGWSVEGEGAAKEETTKRTPGMGMEVVVAFSGQEGVGAPVGIVLPEGTVIGRAGESCTGDGVMKSD